MATSRWRERLARRRKKLVKRYGRRTLRRVNVFLQRRGTIPRQPFHATEDFPWVAELEARSPMIRAELEKALQHRAALPRIHELQQDQSRIGGDGRWRVLLLRGWGHPSQVGLELCPQTAQALEEIPGLVTAFFSVLAPRARIEEHHATDGGLLRCHLGLIVPEHREDCVLTVDGQAYCWEEGRAVVFDDTHPHSVRNDTDEERVVLLLHFERPMDWLGRAVHRAVLALIRRSYFVRDAVENHRRWQKRFRAQADA